jgi:enterobactin synthetase component D
VALSRYPLAALDNIREQNYMMSPRPAEGPQSLLDEFVYADFGGATEPLLQCRYHVDRWHPEAAHENGVVIPEQMARAVPKRLAEFVAGRALAHRLLEQRGCMQKVAIREGERAPLWPPGFVGSITHSHGIAACAVLAESEARSVGIDIEHWMSGETAAAVGERIWTLEEAAVFEAGGWDAVQALTVVFSAKESLYKALNPLCHRFFGFTEAKVTAFAGDVDAGSLTLELQETLNSEYVCGRALDVHYRVFDGYVLAGVWVPVAMMGDE